MYVQRLCGLGVFGCRAAGVVELGLTRQEYQQRAGLQRRFCTQDF